MKASTTSLRCPWKIGGLGVPSGEPTDVDFYISATIGTDFEKFYSAPATVRMTVTTAERTYPQVWVIGDYCGWNFDNAQGLFCFSGDRGHLRSYR